MLPDVRPPPCPSTRTCLTDGRSGFSCAPVLSSYTWAWQPTLGCWSSFPSLSLSAMTIISGGQTFQTPFTFGSGAVNAYSVEVRLQSTDLPLLDGQITSVRRLPSQRANAARSQLR